MSAAEGFVVPAGGGKRFDSPTPGRSFALKLLVHQARVVSRTKSRGIGSPGVGRQSQSAHRHQSGRPGQWQGMHRSYLCEIRQAAPV
jgi:hypothetical protein